MNAGEKRVNAITSALLQFCEEQVKKPTHALTISFRQEAKHGRPITADICAHTLRWLKIQTERKLFKRRVRDPSCRINMVVFVEGRSEFQNLHAHVVLQAPDHVDYHRMGEILQTLAYRHAWLRPPIHIEPWRSRRWDSYIIKCGIDGLVVI